MMQIYSTICLIIYYLVYKYASVLDELIHFCQSVPYLRTRENSFVKIDKRRAVRMNIIMYRNFYERNILPCLFFLFVIL